MKEHIVEPRLYTLAICGKMVFRINYATGETLLLDMQNLKWVKIKDPEK